MYHLAWCSLRREQSFSLHMCTHESSFLCQNTSTSSVFVDITNINRKRLFFHSRKLRFVPTNNTSFPLRSLKKVASI